MRRVDWFIAIATSALIHGVALSQPLGSSVARPAGEPSEAVRFEVALLAPNPKSNASPNPSMVPAPPAETVVPKPVAAKAPAVTTSTMRRPPDVERAAPEAEVALAALPPSVTATQASSFPAVSSPPLPMRAQGAEPIRPVYPWRARRLGHEGKVLVQATYDRDGRLAGLEVARSSGFGSLDREALGAVRRASPESSRKRELLEIVFQLED